MASKPFFNLSLSSSTSQSICGGGDELDFFDFGDADNEELEFEAILKMSNVGKTQQHQPQLFHQEPRQQQQKPHYAQLQIEEVKEYLPRPAFACLMSTSISTNTIQDCNGVYEAHTAPTANIKASNVSINSSSGNKNDNDSGRDSDKVNAVLEPMSGAPKVDRTNDQGRDEPPLRSEQSSSSSQYSSSSLERALDDGDESSRSEISINPSPRRQDRNVCHESVAESVKDFVSRTVSSLPRPSPRSLATHSLSKDVSPCLTSFSATSLLPLPSRIPSRSPSTSSILCWKRSSSPENAHHRRLGRMLEKDEHMCGKERDSDSDSGKSFDRIVAQEQEQERAVFEQRPFRAQGIWTGRIDHEGRDNNDAQSKRVVVVHTVNSQAEWGFTEQVIEDSSGSGLRGQGLKRNASTFQRDHDRAINKRPVSRLLSEPQGVRTRLGDTDDEVNMIPKEGLLTERALHSNAAAITASKEYFESGHLTGDGINKQHQAAVPLGSGGFNRVNLGNNFTNYRFDDRTSRTAPSTDRIGRALTCGNIPSTISGGTGDNKHPQQGSDAAVAAAPSLPLEDCQTGYLLQQPLGSCPPIVQPPSDICSSSVSSFTVPLSDFDPSHHRQQDDVSFLGPGVVQVPAMSEPLEQYSPHAGIPMNTLVQFAVREIDLLSSQLRHEQLAHRQTHAEARRLAEERDALRGQLQQQQQQQQQHPRTQHSPHTRTAANSYSNSNSNSNIDFAKSQAFLQQRMVAPQPTDWGSWTESRREGWGRGEAVRVGMRGRGRGRGGSEHGGPGLSSGSERGGSIDRGVTVLPFRGASRFAR